MQRFFDIILSSLALLVLAPLMIPIIILLRYSGEGEIFFLQERIGRHGTPFKLFKFATMLKDSPNIGTGTVTLKGDPRILPMGHFLRKTKINELPQLINILLGHMSVVGPRPQTPRCFSAFPVQTQSIIVQTRPGLSGLGPIVFRGEEDLLSGDHRPEDFYDQVIAPYKAEVEMWYIRHQGLRTYFTIIGVTIWVVLFPSSDLVWRIFKNLPVPPPDLESALNRPPWMRS